MKSEFWEYLREKHRKLVTGKIMQCQLMDGFVISSLDCVCPFSRGDLISILKISKASPVILAHAHNISTQDAEAGGSSWLKNSF